MNQLTFLDEPVGIRAISLWQPWASLVALGAKKFETRSWATAYRGPLLIHAAKHWTKELVDLSGDYTFFKYLSKINSRVSQLPKGAYIALVDLVEIFPTQGVFVSPEERRFGDYSTGRFAWQLENVRTFEPIPARGYQQLWDPLKGVDSAMKQTIESLYKVTA